MPVSSTSIALDRFTTFGDLLKYLRRRAGYTQRELAIAVGYSDTQISRLEHNERLPDLATLTARFLPILDLENEPDVAKRLLELASNLRREDAPVAGFPPYKGLHYFDEADSDLYFGREALTERLLTRLYGRLGTNERFLAVVGSSGSGKSSLIRAGLLPLLRWRFPSSGWPIYVLTPTAHPLEVLAMVLHGEAKAGLAEQKLADGLSADPTRLDQTLQQIAERSHARQALLIVDQFEELFTLCRHPQEQLAYVQSLTSAACRSDGASVVIIVLRADFYAHCAGFDMLRVLMAEHQEYIGNMTADELRRAIEEPARSEHWELEPGLVDLLLHDIGVDTGYNPEPGALPLLSHAMLATWQRRRGRTLTLSGYTASGGVRGAISETAESVFYDQLDHHQRQIARQIFTRLTELSGDESQADTRRRVRIDELTSRPEEREAVHQVLSALADARLITTDQNAAEVAHEALIREWPTLRGWLQEDREGLRLHRHLTEAAQEWESQKWDSDLLYRGARLAQAMEWVAAHPDMLNELERAFLTASHTLAEQEEQERELQRRRELEAARQLAETERARAEEQTHANRRLRRLAALLAAALALGLTLGMTAIVLGQRALKAESLATSRELAAAAVTNLQVDAERSTLLALVALQQSDTLEARNALRQALPELHLLSTSPPHAGGAPDVAFSPDGSKVASIGAFDDFTIWETASGQPLLQLRDETLEYGNSIAFSPDGQVLATAGVTNVILWDAVKGEKLVTLTGHSVGTTIGYNLGIGQISFSQDGLRLAVANMDGASKVWDLATQSEQLVLVPAGLPAKAIAFSPSGNFLATAGDEGVVTLWDAVGGTQIFTTTLGGIIHSVAFSPDGKSVAAASEDGRVKIWDAASGQDLAILPRLSGMYDVTFLADGRLATAGQDGVTRVWDVTTGQQTLGLTAAASTVIGVAGNPDGTLIATSSYDGSVRLWDARPSHELLTIAAHDGIVWNVAYFPDGHSFASAGVDGTIKIWEANSGRLLRTLTRDDVAIAGYTGLAVSPDGLHLAAGGIDGSITIWDSKTGNVIMTLPGHVSMVTGLVFNADSTLLASASWDATAKVWDLGEGTELTIFKGHPANSAVTNIAFSEDARSIFTGGDDDFVRQWDTVTGREIRTYSGDGKDIYGVALSPDGTTLAMSNQEGTVILWDVNSGDKLQTLTGHGGLALRLAFSQDGTRLASASFDRLAKVWDMNTSSELFSLYGNQSNVFGVSFSPDGAYLATAGADGTVRTYTLAHDELLSLANSRLTRGLTEEECNKFLHTAVCP